MQPDLPWNVAGIPPEAREAARAAARREGLSVGEWLTRRILRSMTEGNPSLESARESWRYSGTTASSSVASAPATTSRDSEDMLARVSRTEADSQDATRRIEEQLRGVARRLDSAERSQSENNRAMSKAAAEINIAAREQAQAFDQLGAHVVGLNERLLRIERDSVSDGLKDAVKALHQGLSRLADQMSQTAHQSASQIAALAGSVEQIAGKLSDARSDTDRLAHTLTDRIAGVEARVRNAERDQQAQAGTVEASSDARRRLEDELQRQASGLAQLNDTLDKLSARFASGEEQQASAMARLEDDVSKLEARGGDNGTERRLQGVEHALSDLASRVEKSESTNLGAANTVEEGMRNLVARFDAADRRQRDDVADLRAAIRESAVRAEPATPAPPPAPTAAAQQPPPPSHFGPPPFPDPHPQAFQAPPPFANTPPMPETAPPFATDAAFAGHPFGADTFAASAAQQAGAAGAESFLASARRSARDAAATQADQSGGPFGFTWGTPRETESEPKSGIARYALMATLGLLIVAAVAAGALLSRNLAAPATLPLQVKSQPRIVSAPIAVSPSTTQAPVTAVVPSQVQASPAPIATRIPATAPGSPVVPLQHRMKPPPVPQQHATNPASTIVAAVAPPKAIAPQTAHPSASPMDRLTALANSGNAKAELVLGLKLLDGDGVTVNEAEAAKWLERAAKQNEAVAAYRLGTLYERGHGVPADPSKAALWYETAAKEGNRKAMHNLAVAYAGGAGVQKDLVVAAQWFTRAANLGLADSQFNLAVLYERGMGVQQSLIDAYKWYAVAAEQGDAESKARIDALSTQLNPEDKLAAQKAAQSFRPDATDRNANIAPDPSVVIGG